MWKDGAKSQKSHTMGEFEYHHPAHLFVYQKPD